jgi:D-cysteine desulfhydrase
LRPLIFDAYPDLEKLPWVELGEFPTPVQKLEALGEAEGFPELYIKRDDTSSSLYGGNKVRKLEFVLADAERKGRRLLITLGAVGSNQVLATGIFGGRMRFRVMGVMMDQPNAEYVRQNLLLDHHYGVEIKHTSSLPSVFTTFTFQYTKNYLAGNEPYYIPGGASNPIGNTGFVNAVFELKTQVNEGVAPEPDYIVAAAGSLGTVSGLELGCRLTGMKARVVGVSVGMPWYATEGRFAGMVNNICRFMRGADPSVPEVACSKDDVVMLGDYVGKEYAYFTELGLETVRRMKELESIPLDCTYTGKALGGGLDWLKKQGLQDKVVLFWDTKNSVDLSPLIEDADYRELPRSVHRYFEEPTQEELISSS